MKNSCKVVFDAERMKYQDTGLYHYCLQLGKALLRQQDEYNVDMHFYVRDSQKNIFGKNANILLQQSLQKFWMPSTSNYDVWHTTYQTTNYFPKRATSKVVFTIHDLNFLHVPKKDSKRALYLKKIKEKIAKADVITTISHFVKREIEEYANPGNKPVHVIYNGSNISENITPVPPAIVPAAPFFFTIGTVDPKKNFHVLPCLLKNNDFVLIISGVLQNSEYCKMIEEEAKRIGVAERVKITGPVSEQEKYWYLQHCSAFVFPSLAEGFGLPVIEAMHFGKPVILSSLTSLPEIGGSIASYFQSFEPGHMREVVMNAIENHTDEKKRASHKWSLQFNWDDAAKAYLNLYTN